MTKPYDRKKNGEATQDTVQRVMAGMQTGLKLQPGFALWMMGYPEDWLDLEAGEMPPSKSRATPSFPKSQPK